MIFAFYANAFFNTGLLNVLAPNLFRFTVKHLNFLYHKFPSTQNEKAPFLVNHIDFCWISTVANGFPGG